MKSSKGNIQESMQENKQEYREMCMQESGKEIRKKVCRKSIKEPGKCAC